MGAAVALRDVVGEAEHGLVVAVVPPQRALHRDAVALGFDDDRLRHQRRLVAIEIFDERLDAAFVAHRFALLDRMAHVGKHDIDAGIEERELAQPVLQRGEVELRHGEGFARRQERHFGAALVVGGADHGERRDRLAVAEFHEMLFAVAPDRQLERARQRIDHRDADAVQAAGNLVGILVEFSAGVQLGHDDLGGGHAFALVDVGGDAAAIVAHGAGAVGIERDHDFLGEAGQRFVDGVVDDLVDHVMQARAVVGVADIHARPLAHGIEPLEHLDRFRVIVGGCNRAGLANGFGHAKSFRIVCKKRRKSPVRCTRKARFVQSKVVSHKILSERYFSRICRHADGANSGLFDGRSGGPDRRRRRRPIAAASWQLGTERPGAFFRPDFSLFALSVPGGRH